MENHTGFFVATEVFFLDIKHPCIFNKQSRECRGPTAPVKQTKLIVKSNQPDALPIWKRGKQIPPAVFTLHGNDCSPLQEKGSGKAVFWCEIGRPQCSKNLQIPCEKVFRHPKPTPKILAEGIGAWGKNQVQQPPKLNVHSPTPNISVLSLCYNIPPQPPNSRRNKVIL